jgi:Protein of unknown function (DUF4232)
MRSSAIAAGVLAATAILVTGCSSGGTSAGSGSRTPTATATTSSPPTATPVAGSSSPAPTPTPSASAGGPGPCQGSALKVALGKGGAAAGTAYYPILFTNVSSGTCTLYGFPGVSFTGETYSVQVGPGATRNHSSPEAVVTLAPGGIASALIAVVDAQNYPPGPCGLTTASGILVYPPNLTTAVGLPFNGYTCVNAKDHVLTVNAVVAGSSGT